MKKYLLLLLGSSSMALASSTMVVHALRLHPGQDIRKELETYVQKNKIEAASILSAVGSVSEVNIRFANQPNPSLLKDFREVVSLSGTTSIHGSHLHIAVSDKTGATLGGHLAEGSKVHTTLEIVLGVYPQSKFLRTKDSKTGFKELEIK